MSECDRRAEGGAAGKRERESGIESDSDDTSIACVAWGECACERCSVACLLLATNRCWAVYTQAFFYRVSQSSSPRNDLEVGAKLQRSIQQQQTS